MHSSDQINVPCSSFVGFSDDNSEWLTPAKRKRKIDHSEGDEDRDSQWEEEEDDADEAEDIEEGEKEQLKADDDDDMVDDYGAMEDSSEGEEQEEEEADSDGEEVWKMFSKQCGKAKLATLQLVSKNEEKLLKHSNYTYKKRLLDMAHVC